MISVSKDWEYYSQIDSSRLNVVPRDAEGTPTRGFPAEHLISFVVPFTCLCPVSGMPDYATLDICYIGKDGVYVEAASVEFYLHGYRMVRMSHEDVCTRVLADLVRKLSPVYMKVEACFTAMDHAAMRLVVEHGTR